MYKKFEHGVTARTLLLSGAEKIYKAVSTTFGPFGKFVISERPSEMPKLTKDGVSVAKEVKLFDSYEEMGSRSLRDIALKTVDRAGDGTTSSIILGYHILKRGIEANLSPFDVLDLKKCSSLLVDYYKKIHLPAKDSKTLKGVAFVSSNGDEEVSELIKEGISSLGEEGYIFVEQSKSPKTTLQKNDGMLLQFGNLDLQFCNKPSKQIVEFDNPFIMVHDKEISSYQAIKPLMTQLMEYNHQNSTNRALVIISPDISVYAKSGMILNLNVVKTAAVQLPKGDNRYMKELMMDLGIMCGDCLISKDNGKELGVLSGRNSAHLSDLGSARKIIIYKDRTLIVPNDENMKHIEELRNSLKENIENCTDSEEIKYLRERLSRTAQGVAILSIGGITEQATKERADRVEDAVCATHAARKEGILPGSCVSFEYGSEFLKQSNLKNTLAVDVLVKALDDLTNDLFRNTGITKGKQNINEDLLFSPKEWKGFDLRNTKQLELGLEINLIDEFIIDPLTVITETIQNSIDVASSLLMVDCAIVMEKNTDNFLIPIQNQA